MALRLVTPFVNTVRPGAYPNINVKSQPVGLGSSGNIVIIGEADGGDSFQNVILKDNYFSPDQFAEIQRLYIRGPIVDAALALTAPSSDADIVGSANRIYILKTNQGAQASAILDTDYGTLSDQNFGADGNKYKYQIISTATESAPTVSGATIAAFGASLDGTTFSIRLNGGAVASVTLSAVPADHADLATLLVELAGLLPAGITASAGAATNSLKLTMDADPSPYRKGHGRSFDLIETTPGDLAALGLSAGLIVASQEVAIELSSSRSDIGFTETLDVSADVALKIGYAGTTAILSISDTALTTTVVGGSGSNLDISLAQFRTIADLVDFINSQTGYSASVVSAARQLAPSSLDKVAAVGICTSVAGREPGRIKIAAYNFQKALGTSSAFSFDPTAILGLPNPMSAAAFLSGGERGATLAADIVDAIAQLASISVNIVVPLFSRNASDDIADGLTDSASTYTIDAIHLAVKNHCLQYSTPKLKRHRQAILSFWGSYADAKEKAQSLSHYRVSLACQKSSQLDSEGNVTSFLPWYSAVVAAGMQAGGFYKSITNKAANVISYEDPSGFDSGSPGDVEDGLEAGLLLLNRDTVGTKWVSDQTSYGFDTNFVYNSIQAVYTSDILALDLADSYQIAFVGKSLADVDAATALAFLGTKMDGYRRLKLIAASSDAPLGWKNPKISILAPELSVSVEIKLSSAIYFIPIDINISQVQQSA